MVNFICFALIVAFFYAAAFGWSKLVDIPFNDSVLYLLVGFVISEFVDRMMEG